MWVVRPEPHFVKKIGSCFVNCRVKIGKWDFTGFI